MRRGVVLSLAAIAFALVGPANAQDGEPVPKIVPPPVLVMQTPAIIPDRVDRVGDGCQQTRYAMANGLDEFVVHVPWRGEPFAFLVGTREMTVREPVEDYEDELSGLRWTIRNARNEERLAAGYFSDGWEDNHTLVGVPEIDLDIGDGASQALREAIAAGDMVQWRVGADIIAEFPAEWLASFGSEWDRCRTALGEYLLNRRAPDGQPADRPIAIGNTQAWIRSQDYPSRSLRRAEEGVTRTELAIDRYGFASDCKVIESSGFPALDEAACRTLLLRARYYPARDARDRPIPGFIRQPVRWQMDD